MISVVYKIVKFIKSTLVRKQYLSHDCKLGKKIKLVIFW